MLLSKLWPKMAKTTINQSSTEFNRRPATFHLISGTSWFSYGFAYNPPYCRCLDQEIEVNVESRRSFVGSMFCLYFDLDLFNLCLPYLQKFLQLYHFAGILVLKINFVGRTLPTES